MATAVRDHGTGACACEFVGDEQRGAWDEFVASRPGAAAYHRYAWRDVVRDVFRRETFYLAARDSGVGAIVGVLPLVRLKSPFFGDFLVSLPYFTYGGVLADGDATRTALVGAACDLARKLGVSHVELRQRERLAGNLPVRTDKVAMILELPADAAALLRQLPAKVRSQIKRPQREGVTLARGGEELLPEFYDVFSANMRDLGTPVYPRRFFAAILRAFPANTKLLVARLGGKAAAAALVVGFDGVLEIPWASSLRQLNALGVNMYLYWSVLEYACGNGYRSFDFGRSTIDSGTYRFKKQWGAEPVQLHWHYWLRDGGDPPVMNPSNPKYRAAIAAWQRLPLFVANRLGPMLARNLP